MFLNDFIHKSLSGRFLALRGPGRRRAFAILIILGVLALMMVLMLSMFSLSLRERAGATRLQSSIRLSTLKDSAVNLIFSQLRHAASLEGYVWSSQPGALRAYGPDGKFQGFKLYSDAEMVKRGEGADEPNFISPPPSNWPAKVATGHYTDLNAPAFSREIDGEGTRSRPSFPILDARLAGRIEGFSYEDPDPANPDDGTVAVAAGASESDLDRARLAMPVSWLYQLQDGTLGTLDDGGVFVSDTGVGASADNPIVGRIAFWADDESSKVNLNTASEGSFWDSPRGVGITEKKVLAAAPPARNEFSRYPGHPASISFSLPLSAWSTTGAAENYPPTGFSSSAQLSSYSSHIAPYFELSPRINFGGSKGGTRTTTASESGSTISMAQYYVQPKTEALYSSADELLFSRDTTSGGRNLNQLPLEAVKAARFLFTTNSSSPDTNPFDMPKVSVWPQYKDQAKRGAMEHLLARTATFGSAQYPFYFQRANEWTNLADSSANSTSLDLTNVPRNGQLYSYLKGLGARDIPGYESSFVAKYGSQNFDQILTGITDYIRSSISKGGSGGNSSAYSANYVVPLVIGDTKGFGQFLTVTEAALIFHAVSTKSGSGSSEVWSNSTPPTEASNTTVQAFLMLETYDVGASIQGASHAQAFRINGLDTIRVNSQSLGFKASALVSMWTETNRYSINRKFPLKGMGEILARSPGGGAAEGVLKTPLNKPGVSPSAADGGDNYAYYSFVSLGSANVSGRTMSVESGQIELQILPRKDTGPSGMTDVVQRINLRFPQATVPVPYHGTAYKSGTTPAAANILNDDNNNLTSRFSKMWNYPNSGTSGANWGAHYASRFQLTRKGDTIRALELLASNEQHRGDVRLIAARTNVPETWFEGAGNYNSQSIEQVHSLSSATWGYEKYQDYGMMGDWRSMGFAAQPANPASPAGATPTTEANSTCPDPRLVLGALSESVPVTDYHRVTTPSMMRGGYALNRENRPGDWDTGLTMQPDGPYINQVDDNMGGTAGDQHYWAGGWNYGAVSASSDYNFSPNRQITSPVKFGSLPTGVFPTGAAQDSYSDMPRPWQTLLFAPNPAARNSDAPVPEINTAGQYIAPSQQHYGFKNPPDHLLLEFFHMPAVEPYPMSEPGATMGRVNMNHQLAPFSNVDRTTALRAAMKSLRVGAISPDNAKHQSGVGSYKYGTGSSRFGEYSGETRYAVDRDETLRGFELMRFNQGRLFRYASEICGIYLVPRRINGANYRGTANPDSLKYEDMPRWWSGMTNSPLITGDNLREQPYSALYPLLTTRSNTYTIHFRVQTLKQDRISLTQGKWDETRGRILADNRGSVMVERFLEHYADLPDYAQTPNATAATMASRTRFRVIGERKFIP